MIAIDRIQAQLRHSARINFEAVSVPPFTLFFNRDDPSPYTNYAIPDAPVGGDLHVSLAQLRITFAVWQRQPRFEFIESYAPGLPATLQQNGFVEETPTFLMICTPATFRAAPEVSGLTVSLLPEDAPVQELQEFMGVLREAFGASGLAHVTEEEAIQYRQRYVGLQTFVARFDGRIVAAGSLTQPNEGLVELAGVGTLERFRGRGVAAALCAKAVETAFAEGIDLVFLTAGDERAGRVYGRVGFEGAGVGVAYSEPVGASA